MHRSDAHDAACDDDAARSVGTPSAPPSIDREGFTFVGFLPPKPGPRKKRLRLFADAPGAVVAFVPPHKLVATLEDCAEVFGAGRRCAVCREMTKVRDTRGERRFFFFFYRLRVYTEVVGRGLYPKRNYCFRGYTPTAGVRRSHPER